MYLDKFCNKCGKLMENVHHAKLYCDSCKLITLKDNQLKHKNKNVYKPKYNNEDYVNNFYDCTDKPYKLTMKGFNSASKLKVLSYRNYYGISWLDLIKKFNKYKELYNYIVSEYNNFIETYNIQNLHKFIKQHNWITYELMKDIGIKQIQNDCNCKKYRYSDQDYIDNFNNVKHMIGRVPLYNEFEKYSIITIEGYAFKYNLKGKVYDSIVKLMVTENEYQEYLQVKMNHKSEIGKITGALSATYTLDDLRNNFISVFDKCFKNFYTYPSKRYFNKISKIKDRTYRTRLNLSWLNVCKYYGYSVNENHKTEKIVLEMIKNLVNHDYEPQKTWDWLIGAGGKHMYCDGFFNNLDLVIEFDGSGHRRPIEKYGGYERYIRTLENDELKNQLIPEHGYKLIRIDSRTPWYDINYLKNLLTENNIPVLQQ